MSMVASPAPRTAKPVLYGYDASTYTRAARLALIEKGVDHDYVRVANWSGYEKLPGFADLHPFGKVPVLDHGGARLYETLAIARYIDAAFDGPPLQSTEPTALARMQQLISVYDNCAFRSWVKVLATQRLFAPLTGATPDEVAITAATPVAARAAEILEALLAARRNDTIDLADLYLAPGVQYLSETPEGVEIPNARSRLRHWWQALRSRPSDPRDPASGRQGREFGRRRADQHRIRQPWPGESAKILREA